MARWPAAFPAPGLPPPARTAPPGSRTRRCRGPGRPPGSERSAAWPRACPLLARRRRRCRLQPVQDYGRVAKSLHWVILALLAAQFTVGWLMPDIKRDMQPESLMNLHLSIGLTLLALMTLRGLWRLGHGVPPPAPSLPRWQ